MCGFCNSHTLGCALLLNYPILPCCKILSGILEAWHLPWSWQLSGCSSTPKGGRPMGLMMAAFFSFASVLGVPMGLFLASLSDWHTPFLYTTTYRFWSLGMIIRYIPQISTEHLKKNDWLDLIYGWWSDSSGWRVNSNQMRAITCQSWWMFGSLDYSIFEVLIPWRMRALLDGKTYVCLYDLEVLFTIFHVTVVGKLSDKYGKLRIFTMFHVSWMWSR